MSSPQPLPIGPWPFLFLVLLGVAGGWLWTEAGVITPWRDRALLALRMPLHRPTSPPHTWGPREFLAAGLHCPPCTGFYPQLAGALAILGFTWWAPAIALTALGGHVVWLTVASALNASTLR